MIDSFPTELVTALLSFLNADTIRALSAVNHRLRRITQNSTLAQYIIELDFTGYVDVPNGMILAEKLRLLRAHDGRRRRLNLQAVQSLGPPSPDEAHLYCLMESYGFFVDGSSSLSLNQTKLQLWHLSTRSDESLPEPSTAILDFRAATYSVSEPLDLIIVIRDMKPKFEIHLLSLSSHCPHALATEPILYWKWDDANPQTKIYGRMLACLFNSENGSGYDLVVWDWRSGVLLLTLDIPGREAEIAILSDTYIVVISSGDNPLTLRVYEVGHSISESALRANFMLPPHSEEAFNHWLYFSLSRTCDRVPFCIDVDKSIVVLDLEGIDEQVDTTYTLIFHLKTLLQLSGVPHSSGVPQEGREVLSYRWEEWGPTNTRILDWEPMGEDVLGSAFGSQYARGICRETRRVILLDFNPKTYIRHKAQYHRPMNPSELVQLATSTGQWPCSGQVRGASTIEGDDLFTQSITTSLPFVFDIAEAVLPSLCVEFDYEHFLVTESFYPKNFKASIFALG